jgi:hypothetical protein
MSAASKTCQQHTSDLTYAVDAQGQGERVRADCGGAGRSRAPHVAAATAAAATDLAAPSARARAARPQVLSVLVSLVQQYKY